MKAAIFDMDGTLLDSMEGWATVGETYLRRRGLTPCHGEKDCLLYQGMIGAAKHFQSAYGIADDIETIIADLNREVKAYYETEAVPCAGVEAFLTMLKERGVRMCVATATDRCLAEPALARLGLLPFFDRIFTCTELATDKTMSLIYDTAAAFLGAEKSETWVFEDAAYAARTAKAAGYPVCAIYDRFEKRAEQLKQTADCYIHGYDEAIAWMAENGVENPTLSW